MYILGQIKSSQANFGPRAVIYACLVYKDAMKLNSCCRYEELRYWYDCLCYEEDLRQYDQYVVEYRKWEEENLHSGDVSYSDYYIYNANL